MRGKLSKNFYRDEFECRGKKCCGHSAPVDQRLVEGLQALRDKVGPLIITSGFRCKKGNSNVPGAAPDSYHTKAMAADVRTPEAFTSKEFAAIARTIPQFAKGGIGIYDNRIHLDVRTDGPTDWIG